MAYDILTDFTRPVAASSDYPSGDLGDNPNGTLVNRVMITDMLQLFHKLLRDASITPSGDPDNVANGYQFLQGLDYRFHRAFISTGIVFSTVGAGPWTWTNKGAPFYDVGFSIRGNMVVMCGVANITTTSGGPGSLSLPVLTLPVAARPSSKVIVAALTSVGGTVGAQIEINTTGVINITFGNTGAGGDVYFDGVAFRIS